MFHESIPESDLAVAAAMFPPVECVCGMCNGQGRIPDPEWEDKVTLVNHVITCPQCEGSGHHFREMDAREEHYYIMHLLQTRLQLR